MAAVLLIVWDKFVGTVAGPVIGHVWGLGRLKVYISASLKEGGDIRWEELPPECEIVKSERLSNTLCLLAELDGGPASVEDLLLWECALRLGVAGDVPITSSLAVDLALL